MEQLAPVSEKISLDTSISCDLEIGQLITLMDLLVSEIYTETLGSNRLDFCDCGSNHHCWIAYNELSRSLYSFLAARSAEAEI